MNSGAFAEEIAPVTVKGRRGDTVVDTDEEPGRGTIEKLPALRPAFDREGSITAGNASTINDGAAAVLVAAPSSIAWVSVLSSPGEAAARSGAASIPSPGPPDEASAAAILKGPQFNFPGVRAAIVHHRRANQRASRGSPPLAESVETRPRRAGNGVLLARHFLAKPEQAASPTALQKQQSCIFVKFSRRNFPDRE